MIRQALTMYRERDKHFGPLPEPQWRILLDLASSGDCSVTSACIASGAPDTTALRHIGILEAAGLVWRRADSLDGRRFWLSLTEEAVNRFTLFEKPALTPSRATASDGASICPKPSGSIATLSPSAQISLGADNCAGGDVLSSPLVSAGAFFTPFHDTEVN